MAGDGWPPTIFCSCGRVTVRTRSVAASVILNSRAAPKSAVELSHPVMVELEHDHDHVVIEGIDKALLLFGHGEPIGEPVASYGPFVMNTDEEIAQAIADYRAGRFNELPAG